MAFYHPLGQLPSRFRLVLSSFMQSEGLAFAGVLAEEEIQQAFDEEEVGFGRDEDAIYTPPLTLWAFLSQVLFKEEQRSCAAAVARVVVLLVALDIRAIKCTLGMDVLRCKTPKMVRREIWTCLLAYNLIRKTMLEAARREGLSPRQLSFTAAMQKIAAGYQTLVLIDEATAVELIEVHLAHLAGQEVGNRPDRVEPRAVKRRPKPHVLLTKPRHEARADLLAGKA